MIIASLILLSVGEAYLRKKYVRHPTLFERGGVEYWVTYLGV